MHPPPTGRSPSPEQIRTLDDSFFSSDPHGYFMSRIESLIAHADGTAVDFEAGLGAEFAKRLGWQRNGSLIAASKSATEMQVAIDAMSLRQHVAEAVARLWLALLQTRVAAPGSVSFWETLTKTPANNLQVFEAIRTCDAWNDARVHLELLLPEPFLTQFQTDPQIRQAFDVLHKWLEHTEMLLIRNDIHVAAANNKYKHGLAVRPRDDQRVGFLPADAIPPEGDTIPLTASAREFVIFDRPFVEYLAEAPRDAAGKNGLELTQLRLDSPVLLVEATMLATLYGCLFHVAAANHATWSDSVGEIAPYPSLPLGPSPERLLGHAVTGMRSPVTFRPDGTPPTRGHAIGFNDGSSVPLVIDYGGHRKMRFVADEEAGSADDQ